MLVVLGRGADGCVLSCGACVCVVPSLLGVCLFTIHGRGNVVKIILFMQAQNTGSKNVHAGLLEACVHIFVDTARVGQTMQYRLPK